MNLQILFRNIDIDIYTVYIWLNIWGEKGKNPKNKKLHHVDTYLVHTLVFVHCQSGKPSK